MGTEGVSDDETPMVMAEVNAMEGDHSGPEPFDYLGRAVFIEKSVGGLVPGDPAYWRAVAAELRRRADGAVDV